MRLDQNSFASPKVSSQEKKTAEAEVVVANAFRKKSFVLQQPNMTFIEEKDAIVHSRKQIVEIFIKQQEKVKVSENLKKLKDLPILIESEIAQIAELDKTRPRFEGRKFARQ